MTTPDELEPAQHDDPDGPAQGWDAADMPDELLLDVATVDAETVLVADGGTE